MPRPVSFGSGEVKPGSDEFHEDWGIVVSREKIRKGIAQCDGHDLFRGCQPCSDGADPRSERLPDHFGMRCGEYLQEALCDDSELDVAMVGGYFAWDGASVSIRFAVHVVVSAAARSPPTIATSSSESSH